MAFVFVLNFWIFTAEQGSKKKTHYSSFTFLLIICPLEIFRINSDFFKLSSERPPWIWKQHNCENVKMALFFYLSVDWRLLSVKCKHNKNQQQQLARRSCKTFMRKLKHCNLTRNICVKGNGVTARTTETLPWRNWTAYGCHGRRTNDSK